MSNVVKLDDDRLLCMHTKQVELLKLSDWVTLSEGDLCACAGSRCFSAEWWICPSCGCCLAAWCPAPWWAHWTGLASSFPTCSWKLCTSGRIPSMLMKLDSTTCTQSVIRCSNIELKQSWYFTRRFLPSLSKSHTNHAENKTKKASLQL